MAAGMKGRLEVDSDLWGIRLPIIYASGRDGQGVAGLYSA
jgi:hypothetical protein